MTDYKAKYIESQAEVHRLLCRLAEKMAHLQDARLAHLEVATAHNDLLRDQIELTERAIELENLIEAFGLCHPEKKDAAWWPSVAPKNLSVPETFEEWEQQQRGGAE